MKYLKSILPAASVLFASQLAASQPNVIMILIDDMGWADSSTYGSTYYDTPSLTRLASEGMLFTDAYAANPLCSPTRASIMAGQHPARLGLTLAITRESVPEPKALQPEGNQYCGLVQSRDRLPLEVSTLAEALKDAGYHTAHIGKWHLAPHGDSRFNAENQGFDFVIGGASLPGPPDYYSPYKNAIRNLAPGPEGEYLNERLADESIQWIDSVKDSRQPFFLNFWHYAVHTPIIPNQDLMPKYIKRSDPQAPQRSPEMASMLESMDNSVGLLLDWLDEPQNRMLKANTIIILTSDNGGVIHLDVNGNQLTSNRPLRGGKANTYEGGTRVPWIVRWPGTVEAGSVCQEPVQTLDLYPSILDMVGVEPPENALLDGQSIVPLLRGEPMEERPIFTDFPHLFGILCAPSSSVRFGDYKLIRFYHAGINAESHAYELFDLRRDPSEAINLAAYMPEKVQALDALIEQHLTDTAALIPIRNPNYTGNPRTSRARGPKAAGRPSSLSLPLTGIRTSAPGSRRLQLLDPDDQPRQTHALVLEGESWVRVENHPDGSVEVHWNSAPKGETAKVLFGWKGGLTAWETNDWTLNPQELVLGASVESSAAE